MESRSTSCVVCSQLVQIAGGTPAHLFSPGYFSSVLPAAATLGLGLGLVRLTTAFLMAGQQRTEWTHLPPRVLEAACNVSIVGKPNLGC